MDTTIKKPLISALMPVFNAAPYLRESIDSILNQTFKDFELIIIDDASYDRTKLILSELEKDDQRIRIYRNKTNLGIANSLNYGLTLAKASIIARMDADDISIPDRLEKQWRFLRQHPEVSVVGSHLRVFESPENIICVPLSNHEIRVRLLFETSFFHPSVMFKKNNVLHASESYRDSSVPAEDYDLWCRLAEDRSIVFANINEALIIYRTHPSIDRSAYLTKQIHRANQIRSEQINKLGLNPTELEIACHNTLAYPNSPTDSQRPSLKDCAKWLDRLESFNRNALIYPPKVLKNELNNRWKALCLHSASDNINVSLIYLNRCYSSCPFTSIFIVAKMIRRYFHRKLVLLCTIPKLWFFHD
ncbi:glycosyltransferase family 2 protein [Methylomonas methanica]|uniref:Glycosyltransferase 2-like domain-containing protein n=1 Tax=Methylomonas methanica TaxID=421 RepID=A0A177MQ05_METMH|nr:glycosyltransferase [Methylomonas methanica]OAI07545.1 hypothetical protein A1332_08660 [Methylomonas methanica]